MMHAIQDAANGIGHSLHSRWLKCGRRLKVAMGWGLGGLSGLSAVVTVCSFIASQTATYIHDQVQAEIRPVIAQLDGLHTDVASLKGTVDKISSISDVQNMKDQLGRIENLMIGLQKKPTSTAANTQK